MESKESPPKKVCTILPDGKEFEGDIVNEVPDGDGVMKFINRDIYRGSWVKGRIEGIGKYRFYDKKRSKYIAKYEGEFKDSSINGFGNMEYADGAVYSGYWKNGLRNGEGQLYFPSGRILSGLWNEDSLVDGVCINPDGSHYSGGLSNECSYSGYGSLFFPDGLWAQGYWEDGELVEGKIFNPNGNVFGVENRVVVLAQKWRGE